MLSAYLWCVYTDELITRIRATKVDCYVNWICIAVICYADDVLAPTISSLQTILDVCYSFGQELDIKYNPSSAKMRILGFGKRLPKIPECAILYFGAEIVQWDIKYKYLGPILLAGPELDFQNQDHLSKFFSSFNGINIAEYKPNGFALLYLFMHQAVQTLVYGYEIFHDKLNGTSYKKFQKAYNTCFRTAFSLNLYHVSDIQAMTGYACWDDISQSIISNFFDQLRRLINVLVNCFIWKMNISCPLLLFYFI